MARPASRTDRLDPPGPAERARFRADLERVDWQLALWEQTRRRGGLEPPRGERERLWRQVVAPCLGVVPWTTRSMLRWMSWPWSPGSWVGVGVVGLMVLASLLGAPYGWKEREA